MAGSYRDYKKWEKDGMKLNTSSDETCKLYDAALKQLTTREDDPAIGGANAAIEKILNSEPEFIMGHVYNVYMGVFGGSNPAPTLENLQKAQWPNLSAMEKSHAKAAQYYNQGQGLKACREWEKNLEEHPRDYLALKMLYETQLQLGMFEEQRDVVASVLPHYNRKTDIEYGYVLGMHAFSLQETSAFKEAETKAIEALTINRGDAWSTHTMAHVYEMTGKYEDGLIFMEKTKSDWERVSSLRLHHHWHTMLYYIEKGDAEGALALYDSEIAHGVRNNDMFPISDAAGALYKLKLLGIDAGKERWRDLGIVLPSHMHDHGWAYYDATIMLGLCGAGLYTESHTFLDSIKKIAAKKHSDDVTRVSNNVNQYLCEAILLYENSQYSDAVDVLLPHKHKIIQIGGSYAQRDAFYLILLCAAQRSTNPQHKKIASEMLHERQTLKDTPFTRMIKTDISSKPH